MSYYIYLVENIENNNVKIGTSTSPKARLSTLQVANCAELILLYCTKHRTKIVALVHESAIHDLCKERQLHIRGEWFLPQAKSIFMQYSNKKELSMSEPSPKKKHRKETMPEMFKSHNKFDWLVRYFLADYNRLGLLAKEIKNDIPIVTTINYIRDVRAFVNKVVHKRRFPERTLKAIKYLDQLGTWDKHNLRELANQINVPYYSMQEAARLHKYYRWFHPN